MKIIARLAFVVIIYAVALPLGSGYSITRGGIPRDGTEVLGGPCKNGVGCEEIKNSECSSSADDTGTCICSLGFHGEDGSSTCNPDSKVGDACADASACSGKTHCSSTDGPGHCTCNKGSTPNSDLICVDGAELVGGPCKNGVGCEQIQNSECSSSTEVGKCVCSSGFDGDDGTGTCTKVPHLNDPCREDIECAYPYGKCVKGMCKCDEQHVEDTTSGLCVASLHGFCKNDSYCKSQITETCTGNSTEVKTCQCKKGYAEDATDKCKAPNQWRCDEGGCQDPHAECVPPNENSSAIICMCKAPYELNEEGKCTDPVPTKLGDSCKTVTDCNGNTECTPAPGPGTCTCKDGFHGDDTLSCVEGDAIIGSACTHNLGCEKVPGLKCNGTDDQGKCTCNDGFHADGEERNCIQDVGSPCNPFVGCFDPAAECKMNQMGDYTCQCREGFEAVGNICKRMDNGLHIRVHVEEAKDIDIEIDKF